MSALPSTDPADCVFCKIACELAGATIVRRWSDAVAFLPKDPVTGTMRLGHVLVITRWHVTDFIESPEAFALIARRASELAGFLRDQVGGDWNFIISAGSDATQTVPHSHGHLVRRVADDGLHLPWTGQAAHTSSVGGPTPDRR